MVTENIRLFYPYVTIHYWSNKIHAEKKPSFQLGFRHLPKTKRYVKEYGF